MEDSLNHPNGIPEDECDRSVAIGEYKCPVCGSVGSNTMMQKKIPHFKDVLVFNYTCNKCGYVDNEIQDAAPLQDEGIIITAQVNELKAINAQLVLSSHAETRLVEIDFGIIPKNQASTITTIEGYINNVIHSLNEHLQSIAEAMICNAELSIELSNGQMTDATEYIHKLTLLKQDVMGYAEGGKPFTLVINDPSGNSYVEEVDGITIDIEKYKRTNEQLVEMGYATSQDFKKEWDLAQPLDDEDVGQEGMCFFVDCPHCGNQGKNKICEVVVPGFGKCVIMAFTCEICGAKSNEIKPGGGYKDYGKKWILKVSTIEDLKRDVILSSTATVHIVELDVEMSPGTVGGVFTSVEGLIIKIMEGIEKNHPFLIGDSTPEMKSSIRQRVKLLEKYANLQQVESYTLIIDDPANHSFIGELNTGEQGDSLKTETYTRTYQQDEELGLIGMNTEDY
ncbi:bifunctional Zinc finger [Babesia duncani]|uniref:Bifunctional Zinc finger n=1 Tax=Babesia duncani TaxID=323732 RepID=A0AAD9PM38_9APIC|nr:bifunctional Zinc finger [Babesia duncani]